MVSQSVSSVAQSCPTLCDPMSCSTPGLPVHHQLPEFTQTHIHSVGDAIQPSHPLSSPSPPALNLSQHRGLFKFCIRWPKYWSFSFSISPSKEHPGLISLTIDWLDLLAVQGTLRESSPMPQFKSINFLALSFLHRILFIAKSIVFHLETFLSAFSSISGACFPVFSLAFRFPS